MKYGIQMYSVRRSAQKDYKGTLRALSKMGYSVVETAGFYGHSAKDVRAMADEYGIEICSTHVDFHELFDDFENTVQHQKELGCSDIVLPWGSFYTAPEVEYYIENINKCIPKLRECGMRLHYHNHAAEFFPNQDGVIAMSEYMSRTDIMLEVDVYWLCVAGIDPLRFIEENRDRISIVHLKDGTMFDYKKEYSSDYSRILGQGVVPIDAVREKARELGLKIIVEHEGYDELEDSRLCLEYLRGNDITV